VCTPYPIAIPVTSGLLSYTSPFNSCNIFQLNDGTGGNITADGQPCAYLEDLSGSSRPMFASATPPSSARSGIYTDDGSGDVYMRNTFMSYDIDTSWRINNQLKTLIILLSADDITSNATTRLFGHYVTFSNTYHVRFNSSNLALNINNTNYNTSFTGTSGVWYVVSIRANNNTILGLDKSYDEVLTTTPSVPNVPGRIGSTDNNALRSLQGNMRDVAAYDRSISDAEMDLMVDYMRNKWNL
jgi:hypothetical protein